MYHSIYVAFKSIDNIDNYRLSSCYSLYIHQNKSHMVLLFLSILPQAVFQIDKYRYFLVEFICMTKILDLKFQIIPSFVQLARM